MARQLKVFRTAIGFHDAYVAAPTQKAALEAWGSTHNLFARGEAELVDDPVLTVEPLAKPGVVVKRLRGSAAEQIAALPEDRPKPVRKPEPAQSKTSAAPAKPRPAPAPRPRRDALDAAERALTEAMQRYDVEAGALAAREAELVRDRRALEKARAEERGQLEALRDKEDAAYRKAMGAWRG